MAASGEGKRCWLISAPKTREDTYNTLNKKTTDENDLSVNYKFAVPDLRGIVPALMPSEKDSREQFYWD